MKLQEIKLANNALFTVLRPNDLKRVYFLYFIDACVRNCSFSNVPLSKLMIHSTSAFAEIGLECDCHEAKGLYK